VSYDMSTVRSRELGHALRLAMEQADLTGKRLATLLGWSESRVSRALTGSAVPSPLNLSALLAVCRVTGDERDCLLHLSDPQTTLGWQTDHRMLVRQQQQALSITAFHGSLVPSLLQVAGYAKAVISRTLNVPFGEVEERVAARLASQQVFERDRPPTGTFFLHELCLQLPVGGANVMAAQLHHLLQLSVRRSITIRVIPTAAGAQPGLIGSCCLLEFADFQPVAYIDNEVAGLFVEEPEPVATYAKVFTALATAALDEESSRDKLRAAATDQFRYQEPPPTNGHRRPDVRLVPHDSATNPC
jgi:transcriptional regulator with XRE-family HTH domain